MDNSHKWNHTNDPLYLFSFTQNNVFKDHPCCSKYQYFISLHVQVIVHCTCIPHFVYLFILSWTFRLFPPWGTVNSAAMNMHAHVLVRQTVFNSLGVELLDNMVILCLSFEEWSSCLHSRNVVTNGTKALSYCLSNILDGKTISSPISLQPSGFQNSILCSREPELETMAAIFQEAAGAPFASWKIPWNMMLLFTLFTLSPLCILGTDSWSFSLGIFYCKIKSAITPSVNDF